MISQESIGGKMIEVYCGPMKAGKSRELLKRIDQYEYQGKKVLIFKPTFDTRDNVLKSRFLNSQKECIFIKNTSELFDYDADIFVIDELQFFNEEVVYDLFKLTKDKIIICAGLDTNHFGLPFSNVGDVLAIADKVHKLYSICEIDGCYEKARYTQRLDGNDGIIVVDSGSNYTVRCLKHFEPSKR